MNNNIVFFSDLDDTLIQTSRKTDFSRDPIISAHNREGKPSSFMYPEIKVLLDKIISSGIMFVPTTARNIDSYNRTFFAKEFTPQYAILNFGGTILKKGKIDKTWKQRMKTEYDNLNDFEQLKSFTIKNLGSSFANLSVKMVDGFYISIHNKTFKDDEKTLTCIRKILMDVLARFQKYYLHTNGNSFAILPKFLNKRFAVEYLIEKNKPALTLGAGDNPSDLDFMNLTNFHIVPNCSMIFHKTNN